mgnify:CR=1 FL=1
MYNRTAAKAVAWCEEFAATPALHPRAVRHSPLSAVLVTNADAVILQVNRAFTDITGYATDEAVGQDMSFLQSGQHAARTLS